MYEPNVLRVGCTHGSILIVQVLAEVQVHEILVVWNQGLVKFTTQDYLCNLNVLWTVV